MTNVEQVVHNIMARENMPVSQDIGDGMGRTGAGGQTLAWCQTWGLPFPDDEPTAAANLVVWLAKTSLLQVVDASLPLGDCVADFCYNVSLRGGIRALQAALGVTPDGVIGPLTLAALKTQRDLSGFVRDVTISRLKALGQGITSGETNPKFALGLISRAVSFL